MVLCMSRNEINFNLSAHNKRRGSLPSPFYIKLNDHTEELCIERLKEKREPDINTLPLPFRQGRYKMRRPKVYL